MKTETKVSHWPGPWTFSLDEEPNGKDFITIEKDGCPLCEVRGTNDMSCIDEEDEETIALECIANTRLIAAAPELLEALEEAVQHIDSHFYPEEKQRAELAIRKAKGV